jgi:hypothetical protein
VSVAHRAIYHSSPGDGAAKKIDALPGTVNGAACRLSAKGLGWRACLIENRGETQMLRTTLLMASCLILSVPVAAQEKDLIGTWRLVSATLIENGKTSDYFGSAPLGQVMFAPKGHFSNFLLRSDVPKISAGNRIKGTSEENAAIVHGSIAYYGTYTITDDTLKLHIVGSTYPNWIGQDQSRTVHISGDRLTWDNASASAGGSSKQIYERIE